MVADIEWFDMEVSTTPPSGHFEPVALGLGANRQPNDVRFQIVAAAASSSDAVEDVAMVPDPPTGYTAAYSPATDFGTESVHYRTVVSGDSDTSVAWPKPPGWRYYFRSLLTARGVDPAVAPIAGPLTITNTVGDGFATISSVSVPAAGDMVFFLGTTNDLDSSWPSWAVSMGVPTGWTHLVASDRSGQDFYAYGTDPSVMVIGKSFASSGSTGSVTVPIADGAPAFIGMYLFVRPAPDWLWIPFNVTANATIGAASVSTSTNPVSSAGSVTARASVGQAFNGLTGYRISDPLYLPGTPVTGSRVSWTSIAGAAGSTMLVETSIDNGATWDTATNGGPVPRLRVGDTVTSWVLTRVTMSRLLASDLSPKLTSLKVEVSCDASVDELVAIGHGPIVKAGAKVGSGSGSGGGAGVASSGGGMTGRGLFLKIKAYDPSRLIAKAPWTQPKILPSLPYDQAVVELVQDRLPTQEDFSVVSRVRQTVPFIFGMNSSDAWQDIRDLATADGCEVFFDASGTFVFRPVRDPRVTRPVWVFDDGETCTVTQAEKELDEDKVFNYVLVKGESTSGQNPASGVAFDDDPASPTYVYGSFGLHASPPITLSTVTTDEQAEIAARAILYGSLGASETVTITTVPVPMLECGDVVQVDIGDIKADGRYLIVQMTTPLSPGEAQTLTCFRQSSQETGE